VFRANGSRRKTVPYPTESKLNRSNSKISQKAPRLSSSLKSLFKKKKKTSDPEVFVMYAGTMSCPVLTPPEPLTPPEHEDSFEDDEKDEMPKIVRHYVPSAPPTKPLPILPLDTFLPKHDISNYESALEKAIDELQNDCNSGARQLADASLTHLAHITEIGASIASTWGKFWAIMVHAARQLGKARPSMSAAIKSCLLRTLERIARSWNDEQDRGSRNTPDLVNIARGLLDEIRKERRQVGARLGENFTSWLKSHYGDVSSMLIASSPVIPVTTPQRSSSQRPKARTTVRILALSNSDIICSAILHALTSLTDFDFHLTILESRPRCEGADMAAQILSEAIDKDRLSVRIVPDCAVGHASRNIDIVLLGADCISSKGDVSNKSGSLAAALCAKQQNKDVAVVVLSDVDKIAVPDWEAKSLDEFHPSRELSSAWAPDTRNKLEELENVEVFGEWFEWVPAKFVDGYITELGILELGDVERVAREIKELDEYIFQARKEEEDVEEEGTGEVGHVDAVFVEGRLKAM
jgi:translation initiation factor 2B subunit (eIF-2B alpha/beta/delta family)